MSTTKKSSVALGSKVNTWTINKNIGTFGGHQIFNLLCECGNSIRRKEFLISHNLLCDKCSSTKTEKSGGSQVTDNEVLNIILFLGCTSLCYNSSQNRRDMPQNFHLHPQYDNAAARFEGEVFKPVHIKGFKDTHMVSNMGRLLRLAYKGPLNVNAKLKVPKILSGKPSKGDGYVRVALSQVGNPYPVRSYMHIMVASVFVPNPHGKSDVNHKDGDKTNNYYKNLEWLSHAENQSHASDLGLMHSNKGGSHSASKITDDQALDIRAAFASGTTQTALSHLYGVTQACISHIVNRKTFTHI